MADEQRQEAASKPEGGSILQNRHTEHDGWQHQRRQEERTKALGQGKAIAREDESGGHTQNERGCGRSRRKLARDEERLDERRVTQDLPIPAQCQSLRGKPEILGGRERY